jgi:predicted dehydrogenase
MCNAQDLKVGIIGLDTSHAVRFAELLNDPGRKDHLRGAVIVAAFKGGSPTVAESADRMERFTQEVTTKYDVKLVPTIADLVHQVDAVMLLSVDGRQHLDQVPAVFAAKKRVFIDKPLAGTLKDAREILKLSRQAGVPFFSCSSERYAKDLKHEPRLAASRVRSASDRPPLKRISPIFSGTAFTASKRCMGAGCERMTRVHTDGEHSVVGTWKDGRIGEIRGLRSNPRQYGAVVFGAKRVAVSGTPDGSYRPVVQEIVKFFQTGQAPVSSEESLEALAFMEAADRSKERKGAPVALEAIK